MRLVLCSIAFAAMLALLPGRGIAAVLTVQNGVLVGATGVDIFGESYTMRFIDGTCIGLFNGCNQVTDFNFGDKPNQSDWSWEAAKALMNQVVIDGPKGQFNTFPALTHGCTWVFNCRTLIPYYSFRTFPDGVVTVNTAGIINEGGLPIVLWDTPTPLDRNTTNEISINYAYFSKNSTSTPTISTVLNPAVSFDLPVKGTTTVYLTTEVGGISSSNASGTFCGITIGAEYFDPCHQPNKANYAIDLSSTNASVVAAKAGTIVSVSGNSTEGLSGNALTMAGKCANATYSCMVIDHGNGLFTEYREFTSAALNTKTGQASILFV